MVKTSDELYLSALKDVQRELQLVRSSGDHLMWLGLLGGFVILGSVGVIAYAALGHSAFMALNPAWYIAGFLVGLGPATASVIAGFLARQSIRTARANTLILRASQLLLMPAETAGGRIARLGEIVRGETGKIDELIEGSHASLEELKTQLSHERELISQSVDQNRKNISEIVGKLADERQALAELTAAVEAQAAEMSDAIPRQARLMAEAARIAQQEVAQTDDLLNERLHALDDGARKLGDAMTLLTEMTERGEASARRLADTVTKVETRLSASAKTVDAAVRASELAASAASETGDSLNAAVASALDGTREASTFIRTQSREAVAEAMAAMAELKQAGEQAQSALLAAGAAARSQAEETERRVDEMSDSMFEAASRATSAAEAGLERARLRIERAWQQLSGFDDTPSHTPAPVEDPRESFTIPPAPSPTPTVTSQPQLRPRQGQDAFDLDDDLTDDEAPTHSFTPAPSEPTIQNGSSAPALPTGSTKSSWSAQFEDENDLLVDDEDDDFPTEAERDTGLSWKDLLAGLDAPSEERDESARYVMSEIEQSDVKLTDLLTSRMVKKISSAGKRGERTRRKIVREYVGTDVQTLIFRLQDDISFRNSAERFLTVEEPDALRSLAESEKSRSPASARLAAYLLLDTAFSSL